MYYLQENASDGEHAMTVTYQNPPLVELIAELRWGERSATPRAGPAEIKFSTPRAKDDELYMHFAALVAAEGFGRFERTVPSGFPAPQGAVVCRFRPTDPSKQGPLFQMGHGIFTANALPPYRSWAEFSPTVRRGIELLRRAHELAGIPLPKINSVLVRYIDAFRDDLTGGRPLLHFLNSVMGIGVQLPQAITDLVAQGGELASALQFVVPTAVGRLEISIGDGQHGNEKAAIFDSSLLIQRDIGESADAALQALTEARGVIHNLFRSLTAPIHQAMRPLQ